MPCAALLRPRSGTTLKLSRAAVAACIPTIACASTDEAGLPAGAELVLEVGDLEVYDVTERGICGGTLRRIELHATGLADIFRIDPPDVRVFLYDSADEIDSRCSIDEHVLGCTGDAYAHASAGSVRHELVHVFVHAATDGVGTSPAIEEGIAFRLDGERADDAIIVDIDDELLAKKSAFEVPPAAARHFFAWVIDDYGIDVVLEAHVAAAEVDSDQVATVFADVLGLSSAAALQDEYVARTFSEYPPLPDSVAVFTTEQLDSGVLLDTSCEGDFAEGPLLEGIDTRTVVRLDIAQVGQYEVEHDPIAAAQFDLRLRLEEPLEGVLFPNRPDQCEEAGDVPLYFFPAAGRYELDLAQSTDEGVVAAISTRYMSAEECPP